MTKGKAVRLLKITLFFGLMILMSALSAQDKVQFSSGTQQSVMIELFTSQGCSSCPPAEHWLNKFKQSGKLWHEVIPIAFHVDYWDKLGWPDPYAHHAYSMRQYRHQQQKHVRSVYTPGVLVNGQEWRGWILNNDFPTVNQEAGVLSFIAQSDKLQVSYSNATTEHVLNVVLLGVGITTKIERGENKGRSLKQEFVALSHEMYSPGKSNRAGVWEMPLPKDLSNSAKRYALAIWVSNMDDISPIQSIGHWIPAKWVVNNS